MDLFGFKRRKKERKEKIEFLLKWQNDLTQKNFVTLVMTEQQLKATTVKQANDDLRIIKDCIDIVERTYKPDTFFSRLKLLVEKSKHLASLEKYANFAGIPTTNFTGTYNSVMSAYNDFVKWFLIRYHTDVHGPASALKTRPARLKRYQKWYDSLQEYYPYMKKEHIAYIESEFTKHMKYS